MGYQVAGFPALAVVKLGDLGRAVWEASRVLGGPERWGLFLMPDFPFEPFSYATALIDETFRSSLKCLQRSLQKAPAPISRMSRQPSMRTFRTPRKLHGSRC